MYEIAGFFEPLNIGTWALKMFCQIGIACLIIWAIAFVLCRIQWSNEGNVILNVYFGWLAPITLYAIIATIFVIVSAMYYKEMGISLWFCVAYLFPVFVSGIVGINLSRKIKTIVAKKQLNMKGGEK